MVGVVHLVHFRYCGHGPLRVIITDLNERLERDVKMSGSIICILVLSVAFVSTA